MNPEDEKDQDKIAKPKDESTGDPKKDDPRKKKQEQRYSPWDKKTYVKKQDNQ